MYHLLCTDCADAVVVSSAHRRCIGVYHERRLLLTKGGAWRVE